MQKQKKKYRVYYIGTGTGCYAKEYKKIFIKEVWAKSEKQACSYARYSLRDKQNPHGGYSTDIMEDRLGEGTVFFEYKAEEVK